MFSGDKVQRRGAPAVTKRLLVICFIFFPWILVSLSDKQVTDATSSYRMLNACRMIPVVTEKAPGNPAFPEGQWGVKSKSLSVVQLDSRSRAEKVSVNWACVF